jgi:hypothetical protein
MSAFVLNRAAPVKRQNSMAQEFAPQYASQPKGAPSPATFLKCRSAKPAPKVSVKHVAQQHHDECFYSAGNNYQ